MGRLSSAISKASKMKFFLALLLVASCQAIELFDTTNYEAAKEVELKNVAEVAEKEMLKQLMKEYPNEDPEVLQQLAHQIALLVKHESDMVMDLVDQGTKMAKKLTHNMWNNLKNAAADIVDGLESVPESMKKFTRDLIADAEEMEKHGVLNINLDELFDRISERVAFKVEYGELARRDIWGSLNDTLHRIIGHLNGKFADLKDFFHKTIKIGAEKLQPHLVNMKSLAKDLLNNLGVVSKKVALQALEFFRPFHKQLGDLWVKLVKAIDAQFPVNETPY